MLFVPISTGLVVGVHALFFSASGPAPAADPDTSLSQPEVGPEADATVEDGEDLVPVTDDDGSEPPEAATTTSEESESSDATTTTTNAGPAAEVETAGADDKLADDELADEEMSDEEMEDMDMGEEGGHHAMAHPFYVHMGLPDGPGEANIRVFGIGRLGNNNKFGPDGGFHIEAGLVPRLGIHIRNDAIWRTGMVEAVDTVATDSGVGPVRTNPDSPQEEEGGETSHTEFMAMLSILQNDAGTRGLSLFGQIAFPTVRNGDELAATAAFGPSGRIMVKDRFVLDANFHVAASSKKFAAEYEAGAMVRVVSQLFVMVENRGEVASKSFESFILPGVKYRFGPISVGLAAQVPVTPDPLYRVQGMFQLDVGFM